MKIVLMQGSARKKGNTAKALKNPHKAINAGELFLGNCTTPGDMGEEVQQKVLVFAKKIVA